MIGGSIPGSGEVHKKHKVVKEKDDGGMQCARDSSLSDWKRMWDFRPFPFAVQEETWLSPLPCKLAGRKGTVPDDVITFDSNAQRQILPQAASSSCPWLTHSVGLHASAGVILHRRPVTRPSRIVADSHMTASRNIPRTQFKTVSTLRQGIQDIQDNARTQLYLSHSDAD